MTNVAPIDPIPDPPPSDLRIWVWFVLDVLVAAAAAAPFVLMGDTPSAALVASAVLSAAPRPPDPGDPEGEGS